MLSRSFYLLLAAFVVVSCRCGFRVRWSDLLYGDLPDRGHASGIQRRKYFFP